MALAFGHEVAPEIAGALLAAPSRERRVTLLASANLLNSEGLDQLLELAAQMVGEDPGKAHRLADICAEMADLAHAPLAVPRAAYVKVQTHYINGEFEDALRMAGNAHDGYLALGEPLEALRTYVGRMAILLEQGHYAETLDTGQVVLDALDGRGDVAVNPTPQEATLLAALVHQNRGVCYEYMGHYEEALDAHSAAEEGYRSLGMNERLGEILDNRGAILLGLGRGTEALAAHEAAAEIFEKSGLTLSYAKSLGNAGETLLRLADYARSLDTFERARHLLRPLNALTEECFLLRSIADAYLELNLYPEALAAYGEANALLSTTGMAHDRARALWGMGSVLVARSELDEAERALTEAAKLFEEAGNLPLLSGVMLEQASLLEARGEREAALKVAERALALISAKDSPVQAVYAHLRVADLSLPDVEAAEPHLRAARRLSDRLALPHLRYRLDERFGHLRRLQGRDREALESLEAAVDEIERLRGTVSHEAMRASFLRDKTAAYEDLLQLHLDRGDEEGGRRAFAVAERAKSRALVDLLTGVIEKDRRDTPADGHDELIRDLQADLNAIYSKLLAVDEESASRFPDLQRRAVALEREISRLRLETAPSSDLFAAAMPPEAVQERLPPDVALLSYHIVEEEIIAFVAARGEIRVSRNLGPVTAIEHLLRGLEMQWDRFRAGPGFVRRHMDLLERSTLRILSSLHDALIKPLEPLLSDATARPSGDDGEPRRLVIVPHGPLHGVPFHALFDGERHLLEDFEISYAPSATVYTLCQKRAPRVTETALVIGVSDPLIPAVSAEARAVARRFRDAELLTDGEATVERIGESAAGAGIVHLACHGQFRSDNPMFSALKLHDGWLTAADVMALDFSGALVTLSACESGRNEVFAGDELIGLTRAFLGAGAATLVVSLWLVQDETTARLMEKYYELLKDGAESASALREAQLALKQEFPHPYYWAPFILTGHR